MHQNFAWLILMLNWYNFAPMTSLKTDRIILGNHKRFAWSIGQSKKE